MIDPANPLGMGLSTALIRQANPLSSPDAQIHWV